MIKLLNILNEHEKGEEYPPYMYSSIGFGCHVCEYHYIKDNKHMCSNKEYKKYMKTDELIEPKTGKPIKDPSKWCSNWFEPKSK